MLPYLGEYFGNPSTTHAYGEPVKEAVERARQQVASLIGAAPEEVIFTSGGSESDNHAIVGTALANSHKGKHIITMSIEHPAVLNTCRYLEERLGFKVTYLPVDKTGLVNPEDVRRAITEETILITIMHANNEVGTIEPVAEIGEIARERGVIFHTDAAQSCGKIRVDVKELKVDLLTIAGHKLYAPKGIGALFIRRGVQIDSLIHGAGQERGKRAGTENVPYMVGLGKACELAGQALSEFGTKVKGLRDRLYQMIVDGLGTGKVHLNGHPERRLPNTLNISIRGISGDELLNRIPELAASTGAACHAGSTEPSSVLLKMGLSRELALGALRLTLGRWSTTEEMDTAAELIIKQVKRQTVPRSA
jgi:cysteine desulfurase